MYEANNAVTAHVRLANTNPAATTTRCVQTPHEQLPWEHRGQGRPTPWSATSGSHRRQCATPSSPWHIATRCAAIDPRPFHCTVEDSNNNNNSYQAYHSQ